MKAVEETSPLKRMFQTLNELLRHNLTFINICKFVLKEFLVLYDKREENEDEREAALYSETLGPSAP